MRAGPGPVCTTPDPLDAREALERAVAINGEGLPPSYFESLKYDDDDTLVPWDLLGVPQPCVRNAVENGDFGPRGTAILDVGCGAGDNANYLAKKGYDVLGFDLSENALAAARKRAAKPETAAAMDAAAGSVEYVRASATSLGSAERVQERARQLGGFEVALDSALLHCLDDAPQRVYLDGLRELLRPGAALLRPAAARPCTPRSERGPGGAEWQRQGPNEELAVSPSTAMPPSRARARGARAERGARRPPPPARARWQSLYRVLLRRQP